MIKVKLVGISKKSATQTQDRAVLIVDGSKKLFAESRLWQWIMDTLPEVKDEEET